jgi:leucyl/phenylalanyl-tRNA--protein transferase
MEDVVAVGLDLKPATLIQAYSQGIFPWPCEDLPLLWHCPLKRGVLLFKELHVSKRLKQYLKKSSWKYSVNREFEKVIGFSQIRKGEGTWITPEMKEAYCELHRLGHAHSVEVWNGQELIGGLYGVDVAGYFAGESMFHREDNASKAALLFAIALLIRAGRTWMDIQMVTPHMEAMGGKLITKKRFLTMLQQASTNEHSRSAAKPFKKEDHPEFYGYSNFSTLIEKFKSSAVK